MEQATRIQINHTTKNVFRYRGKIAVKILHPEALLKMAVIFLNRAQKLSNKAPCSWILFFSENNDKRFISFKENLAQYDVIVDDMFV